MLKIYLPGAFVMGVLATPLDRMELLQNLDRYILEFHTTQNKPQASKPSGSKSAKRKPRPSYRRGKPMTPYGSSAASTTTDPQSPHFQEIIKRLTTIEKILERRESNPFPSMTKNALLEEYESLGALKEIIPSSFLGAKYNNLNISR
jgi:5-methylcytosine-specific restriction endonuclease McrBC GTP-binding regulatory subunit McrB